MKRNTGSGTIAALILTVIFGAALLLSIASGASVYRHVADRVETGSRQRVGLSYITAKIHGSDETDSVHVGKFGNTDALFISLVEDGDVYENVIYVYNGYLMELLCEDAEGFGPEDGEIINEAVSLNIDEPVPSLLRFIYTDESGTVEAADVYLRSGGR